MWAAKRCLNKTQIMASDSHQGKRVQLAERAVCHDTAGYIHRHISIEYIQLSIHLCIYLSSIQTVSNWFVYLMKLGSFLSLLKLMKNMFIQKLFSLDGNNYSTDNIVLYHYYCCMIFNNSKNNKANCEHMESF